MKTTRIDCRLRPEVKKDFKTAAAEQGVKPSELLRNFIIQFINKNETQAA